MELTGGDERAPERSSAAQGGQLGARTIQARPPADQDTITPAEAIAEVGGTVSLRAEVPEDLLRAMRQFIESHPNWDQYRLVQAALAGFLVQNGIQSRGVTRCYLANLFPGQRRFSAPAHRGGGSRGGSAAPRASRAPV